MNRVCVSAEFKEYASKHNIDSFNKKVFKGLTPADKYDCECQPLIKDMMNKVAEGKKPYYIECPKDKKKMKNYKIKCKNCGSYLAEVYATDDTLQDYSDLHYLVESDGVNWFGAMSLQLSPIDGRIGIECTCGQDTRDFRTNNTLPSKQLSEKIKETMIGKDFAKTDSKFIAEEVK